MAPKGYSRAQIGLHWGMAGLIAVNLIFEDWIKAGWEWIEEGGPALYDAGSLAHIGVGVTILALVLWRLTLRFTRGVPDLPQGGSSIANLAGHLGHGALYALMIVVPVLGLLAWFGASEDLAEVHELGKPAFLIVIGLHVLAALWHHFWLKDGLLLRMKRAAK